jgi:hypothetical protein
LLGQPGSHVIIEEHLYFGDVPVDSSSFGLKLMDYTSYDETKEVVLRFYEHSLSIDLPEGGSNLSCSDMSPAPRLRHGERA